MSTETPDTADDEVSRLEVRALSAERLSFFADAVIAIAITLLALELPKPEGTTNAELLHSVGVHRGDYIAFLISFLVIGSHWAAHQRVFRYVTSVSGGLIRLSLAWLLMQVLTPFATKVLADEGAFQFRFTFYAGVQVAAFGLFLLMAWQLRRQGLVRPDTPSDMFMRLNIGAGAMAIGFAVSIPVAFFTERAYAFWIVVPFLSGFVMRIKERRKTAR